MADEGKRVRVLDESDGRDQEAWRKQELEKEEDLNSYLEFQSSREQSADTKQESGMAEFKVCPRA